MVVNLSDVTVDGGGVRSRKDPDQVGNGLAARLSRDLDAAFAEVVREHERAVFTTALRVSGQAADAQDLAAETFLHAYAALRGYTAERIRELKVRPWLITICLNQWRNHLRTASRRPQSQPLRDAEPTSGEEGPEEGAARVDSRDRLATVLQELPDKQRVAVVLRHVVGLSHSEVGDVLGCPEGTAKSHVSRGLDRLRAITDKELS